MECFFCENTVEQLTWTSTLGFLQKSEKGKQRNPPEKGKKLEKQCFSNKSLIAVIVVSRKKKLDCTVGESGYRSRYLPHAKRALYHLS